MNIRTITYFVDPGFPVMGERIAAAGTAAASIKAALVDAGFTVQTLRLATPPFPRAVPRAEQVVAFAQDLEAACFVSGFDYAAIGPARPVDSAVYFEAIPDALGATQNIMASAIMAEPIAGISLPAVRLAARIIQRCSRLSPDGFGNLRFCALANVPGGVPFFPAAYHDGSVPAVAIGVEAADLAVRAVETALTLVEARAALVAAVQTEAQRITTAVKRMGSARGVQFGGIDFSLAPYPEAARSVGTALERLSGGRAGEHGTLAAAAFLTETMDRASFKRAGFSGLFLPVFEDAVLAQRAVDGTLSLSDLLLYCSVCGTGLDTVPLPGDVTPEALAAVLLDVAALALRLNKPLTARLMPIPGKQAGDPVAFDFPYFAPARVLGVRAAGLGGLFVGDTPFELTPRTP